MPNPRRRLALLSLALLLLGAWIFLATSGCAALIHASPRQLGLEAHLVPPTTTAAVPPPSGGLRVVTYNIHGISGDALVRALRSDPAVAAADLILLQEVSSFGLCSAACAAAARLGMASVFAPGHQQDGGLSGVAILSRWPLRDPQIIELPYRHAVMNSARRIALAATFDSAGGPVRVIAAHLENRVNPAARISQLAPALEHAQRFEGAVILAGDMNTSPFLWIGHLLPIPAGIQDDRLDAAARRAGLDTPVADVGATSPWLGMRLDAIYTRGLGAGDHGVAINVRASDHLPLWLDAKIDAAPRRLRVSRQAR